MPGTDPRFNLPALHSLELPTPAPERGAAAAHAANGNAQLAPIGAQTRPSTSAQSLHQFTNNAPPSYRNGAEFSRLPSLAGVAAALQHTQQALPVQDSTLRESTFPPQTGYDSSRILPPPVPRVQMPSGNYGSSQSATLPPMSANGGASRDNAKYEEPAHPNPFHSNYVSSRLPAYNSPMTVSGENYHQQMSRSYSTSTLLHGRTPSQDSTFVPPQNRPMTAASLEGTAFYSPVSTLPSSKNEAWAGEDQYAYLSGTVNGVTQDPNDMDPASIMQVVLGHCNAIVQFTAQFGATPNGALQTPSPSPNAGLPQGVPEDKLAEMVDRAIAVVRLLRTLNNRQTDQDKNLPRSLMNGLEADGVSNLDGESIGSLGGDGMRPSKRLKTLPAKESGSAEVERPKPKYKKRNRAPPPSVCASCCITETPEWRTGPDGARTLCNACGLHYAKLIRNKERFVRADGRVVVPIANIEMLRSSRANGKPTRSQSSTRTEPQAGPSTTPTKAGPVQERVIQEPSMPMVWEAPIAVQPQNPATVSVVEQSHTSQMQASYPSSGSQQSPVESLHTSGYATTVDQSQLHTPTYASPVTDMHTPSYPAPMQQAADPLYRLAQAACNTVPWGTYPPQGINSQAPPSAVSATQPQRVTVSAEHQYWQQPQTSMFSNQMSNVRTDMPETRMDNRSTMQMQQGQQAMGYGHAPDGNSAHQLSNTARVYD